ncbi:MAG: purine-binding chemotaxis protein CheW [Oligoflexus sp.]|nr:purine-binding chemotaxis protein CheW [Oligoflexus sp.]
MNDNDLEQDRYLLFTLNQELYATPLMGVREVVEMQKPKPIPHTIPSFLGVINIRGEIVGVMDLRVRLGYQRQDYATEAMMVFDTPGGSLAAIVDSMEGVTKISPEAIDRNPSIESRLPLHFLIGVGRIRDRLVTLIDIGKVLEKEEVRTAFESVKKTA